MCVLYVVVVVVIVFYVAVTSGFQQQGGRKKRTAKRPMTERLIEQPESCSVLSMRLHALNWPHIVFAKLRNNECETRGRGFATVPSYHFRCLYSHGKYLLTNKWTKISKVILKSLLLNVNLFYFRLKSNRNSYNSCTQPSKRQRHKFSSRNSVDRGRISRSLKNVLNHQKQGLIFAAPLDPVFFLPASSFPEQRVVIEPNLKLVLFGLAFGVDGVRGCRNQVL